MALKYPKNPRFNKLQMRSPDYATWQEGCAHDPSLLEWEGRFYAYSTDTFGAPGGYQIRVSDDLVHWEYAGTAFALEGAAPLYKKGKGGAQQGGLQAAFDWCVTDQREVGYGICTRTDGTMSFWAPHCVRGTDGMFWLYFCLTGYFGGSRSCIGLAKAASPLGPFVCEGLIVCSPAGWRTPNAIDPQVLFAEGRLWLVYGSYGLGLFLLELDPATGLRKDGLAYADLTSGKCTFGEYYGVNLACGSLEGGVLHFEKDVPVCENGKWSKRSYYYLMCSFGSLSSAYNMRCARSERPEGPYTDVNGNPVVCSTDIGTGNKMLGSFRWEGDPVDYFCPGHNDIFTTSQGVRLIAYHCRTNYFIEKKLSRSNNFHYLYLSQYDFNSEGWPVMNPNRYAGEEIQDVTEDELLNITAGKFEAVVFRQGVDTLTAKRVILHRDGTMDGAFRGTWRMYGARYIAVETQGDVFLGVVMPAWIDHQGAAGLSVTAMGRRSGMALLLNSTYQI